MKLYINRFQVTGPWGGGAHFFNAFHEFAESSALGIDLLNSQNDQNINPEVILLAGLENDGQGISAEQAIMYKLYVKPDCKIVLRVNECDARKGTDNVDDVLVKVSEHIDATVFVSRWLQDYFNAKGWKCPTQAVIYNGIQRSVFKPQPKLNNGKLNIVAHHWSDNYMKGFDIYEKLDEYVGEHADKFAFTYIGRDRKTFKHTNVVKPLHGKALGEELGKHDVYVSASRFDPGPNHVLEALACGLPTWVHEDGGGAVEFAGEDHSYHDWNELQYVLDVLASHTPEGRFNDTANTDTITIPTWKECIKEYIDFLEATWNTTP